MPRQFNERHRTGVTLGIQRMHETGQTFTATLCLGDARMQRVPSTSYRA
jgi:hypothetical protein